jgi:hypothetical protein
VHFIFAEWKKYLPTLCDYQEENMKNALICGADGFIGSHMVKRLKKRRFIGAWRTGMKKTYKWIEDQVKHGDNK